MIAHSQLAPLPSELPFQIVSKTIGQGAYACIKKARPLDSQSPIFAVKFIHKAFAIRHGRITLKQLNLEISLHRHLGHHPNIVQFYQSGEDDTWKWIAMELAEGGDLFDKIESDVGIGEDIAHFYFTQLVSAIAFMHSKGVGHRDIKPENILLSASGDLKLADFGLATLFLYKGAHKLCKTSCGSPPYTAPEVLICAPSNSQTSSSNKPSTTTIGYSASLVDIWSLGVVLFVLLAGNTPWDEPLSRSYEFHEYLTTAGRPTSDPLWLALPSPTLSLLRGMMRIDPASRFSLDDVRRHPWFTRPNPFLAPDGHLVNPIGLATQMLESMRIDFDTDPLAPGSQSQRMHQPEEGADEAMDIDDNSAAPLRFAATQPETPTADLVFDWEKPPRYLPHAGVSASQPLAMDSIFSTPLPTISSTPLSPSRLAEDPSLSQFSATPLVPLSLTQAARRFGDVVPAHSLTRLYSAWPVEALLPLLAEALHRLGVPVAGWVNEGEGLVWVKVKTLDGRGCALRGEVVVEGIGEEGGGMVVEFVKGKGDPVEWRRFFKRVVVLCKEAVWRPER